MAQKVQVLYVDDIEGGEAEETVAFGVDGASYEIDLNGANAARLREALTPFVAVARKAPRKSGGGKRGQGKSGGAFSRDESARIREWARAHGKEVNERGRIPRSIVDEYRAVHG